jgi:hypothetical protein
MPGQSGHVQLLVTWPAHGGPDTQGVDMLARVRSTVAAVVDAVIGLLAAGVSTSSDAAVIATYNLFGASDGRVAVGLDPSDSFDLTSGTSLAHTNAGWLCAHLAPELWKFRYYSNALCIDAVMACSEAAAPQGRSPGVTFTFDGAGSNYYRCWTFAGSSASLAARETSTAYPNESYPAKTLAIYDGFNDPGLQRPSFTQHLELRDGAGSGDVAEVSTVSFRLHSTGGLTYSMRYLGWNGKPRAGYVDHGQFISYAYGFAAGYDRIMQPQSCLAAGLCVQTSALYYTGLDGRAMVAVVT